MATNSKIFKYSLKRCETPSRRRESSPLSQETKPSGKSPSVVRDMDRRNRTTRRSGWRHRDRTRESHRHSKTTRPESSIRRITSYGRHSESNYSGNSPKTLKKENCERRRYGSPCNSRHIYRSHYSKTYDNRMEERRRVARRSKERSRSRDGIRHDDVESHRNFLRTPMTIAENYECQSRLIVPTPPPIAVPRRILLPHGLVPRPPHLRLPFPTRVVRGVAPVLLTPVMILRGPMMPLRPPPVAVTASRLC